MTTQKKAQVYLFLNGETKSSDNNHATAAICSISQRLYEVVWSRLKSHDCVKSSHVVWIKSTCGRLGGHFSFKRGHISWPQRLAGLILSGDHNIYCGCRQRETRFGRPKRNVCSADQIKTEVETATISKQCFSLCLCFSLCNCIWIITITKQLKNVDTGG